MKIIQTKYFALNSDILITLVFDQSIDEINLINKQLINKIDSFENQFSRFKIDSELTKFNLSSGNKNKITKEFREILLLCIFYNKLSNGLFNPFILPVLQSSGYKGSWPNTNDYLAKNDFSNRHVVDFSEIILNKNWAKIPTNTAIDLGGIGKGFLLDKLANYLKENYITRFWISLGGDIISQGFDNNDQPFKILVQDANNSNTSINTIYSLKDAPLAVATSGITKRKGIHQGTTWNHIIDPKNLKPTSNTIQTVTVTADNAATADVLAKSILIGGEKIAKKYIKNKYIKNYFIQNY